MIGCRQEEACALGLLRGADKFKLPITARSRLASGLLRSGTGGRDEVETLIWEGSDDKWDRRRALCIWIILVLLVLLWVLFVSSLSLL